MAARVCSSASLQRLSAEGYNGRQVLDGRPALAVRLQDWRKWGGSGRRMQIGGLPTCEKVYEVGPAYHARGCSNVQGASMGLRVESAGAWECSVGECRSRIRIRPHASFLPLSLPRRSVARMRRHSLQKFLHRSIKWGLSPIPEAGSFTSRGSSSGWPCNLPLPFGRSTCRWPFRGPAR